MATTARLDLSIWRNDDVYEFPVRIIGPNLTNVPMRAQVRLGPDVPGAPLVALNQVLNGNAEGVRLASANQEGGVWRNDVRIRINKSTRQGLPYAGEAGEATVLNWGFQIGGRTRIQGQVYILASVMDSDAAPTSRPYGYSARTASAAPSAGASLTIADDSVAELVIDGADLIGSMVTESTDARDAAQAAQAGAVDAAGDASLSASAAAGFVGGVMFASVAAGLAATTEGGFFTVAGDGTSTYAILYRQLSGVAVEQARYASKAAYEGPAGATLIGSKRPEPFAITRRVDGRLNDRAHIRDFGADPSETAANNTTAIRHAFDAVLSTPRQTLDFGDYGDFQVTQLPLPANSDGLTLIGRGARLMTASDAAVISIGGATNATIDGLRIWGSSGSVASDQAGIILDGAGYCRVVNTELALLSTGILARNSTAGLATGAIPQPSEVSSNLVRSCFNGIYTEDDGAGHYGEYLRIATNSVTDCRNAGILSKAGNTAIVNNSVNANGIGIFVLSTGTANGDHGMVVGNTANHNKRANFYAKDLLRSLIVSANNFWAAIGDGTSSSHLEGVGDFAETFGAVLNNVRGVVFTNNVLGRNRINLGLKMVIETIIAKNYLTADPDQTVDQIRDFSDFALTISNSWGPNVVAGSWTSGNPLAAPDRRRAPAFVNGWSVFGGSYSVPAYWKDEDSIVHLEGLIIGGAMANSAFTLPIGFRPVAGDLSFAVVSNGLPGFVQVTGAGSVIPAAGSNAWVSLDGISFRAA